MAAGSKKLSPSSFHNFFSLGAGAVAVRLVHHHEMGLLAASQALWLCSLIFIHVRAKRAGGMFLESDEALYHGFSIPFYIVGVLLVACFYTVYG